MAVYSKHQIMCALENTGCQQLIHPWTESCTISFLNILSNSLRGSYKFFLIIYLAQLVMKGRKVTRTYLKNQVRRFFKSLMFGVMCTSVTLATSCGMRNIFGKFYFLTIIGVPALIGGLTSIFFEAPVKRALYAFTFTQMCVEYLVRVLEKSDMLTLTRCRETLVFMCFNASLLYLLKTDETKRPSYWFFRPASVDKRRVNIAATVSSCQHPGPCWKYVLKSASKYMSFGLGLQFLRILLTKTKSMMREPRTTLTSFLLDKHTYELGSFFGAYIGIFGCVTCLLSKYRGADNDLHALPAGFLAGCAYWLHPNRTIGAAVLTNTMLLLLRRGLVTGMVPVVPFASEIISTLACAVMFHTRFVDFELCPRFVTKAITTVTNGRSDDVYTTFLKIIDKFHQ